MFYLKIYFAFKIETAYIEHLRCKPWWFGRHTHSDTITVVKLANIISSLSYDDGTWISRNRGSAQLTGVTMLCV